MKIRFYNARILTMVDGQEMFNGELVVEDNKIVYVGCDKQDGSFDKETTCPSLAFAPNLRPAESRPLDVEPCPLW